MADMLSQEEIDALLKGTPIEKDETNIFLADNEKDALGEIGNISMGTAATTLFTLLGEKVTITTPKVSEATLKELSEDYPIPCVAVIIKYKKGIEGFNLLILKENDVKVITDLMMGGDGTNISQDLTDLHLSAIGEAMNQMIGSACTSLSEMFNDKIDILPPEAYPIDFSNKKYGSITLDENDKLVKVAFRMTVGSIIDSEIMQIIPIQYAKQMVSTLLNGHPQPVAPMENDKPDKQDFPQRQDYEENDENNGQITNDTLLGSHDGLKEKRYQSAINIKPLQFESFDEENGYLNKHNDISLIRDVPLSITVELGRTVKQISEILDFGPGTVIELDKLVGEPLDILVNGKPIAKGEVVVVDENYGIRITDIIVNKKDKSNLI